MESSDVIPSVSSVIATSDANNNNNTVANAKKRKMEVTPTSQGDAKKKKVVSIAKTTVSQRQQNNDEEESLHSKRNEELDILDNSDGTTKLYITENFALGSNFIKPAAAVIASSESQAFKVFDHTLTLKHLATHEQEVYNFQKTLGFDKEALVDLTPDDSSTRKTALKLVDNFIENDLMLNNDEYDEENDLIPKSDVKEMSLFIVKDFPITKKINSFETYSAAIVIARDRKAADIIFKQYLGFLLSTDKDAYTIEKVDIHRPQAIILSQNMNEFYSNKQRQQRPMLLNNNDNNNNNNNQKQKPVVINNNNNRRQQSSSSGARSIVIRNN
jgi:hypothetical protein